MRQRAGYGPQGIVQKSILVVDDHPGSREGLREWLAGAGWRVDTAADGWQAIEKIRSGRFQVAVIDLDLPPIHGIRMNGWDLVRIVHAFSSDTAVILVSAEGGQDVKARAAQLEVAGLLEKPINPNRLHALVETLGP